MILLRRKTNKGHWKRYLWQKSR